MDLLNIHEENPFLGTSLLRDDVDERFVLIVQDNHWNMRFGNEYVYFSSNNDLVGHWNPTEIKELPEQRVKHLLKFGNQVSKTYSAVIARNQIWPPKENARRALRQ